MLFFYLYTLTKMCHVCMNQCISMSVCLVQALGKVRVDVQELAVDYLTVVGHKFYGPRAGALYARGLGEYLKSGPRGRGAPLYPILSGGGAGERVEARVRYYDPHTVEPLIKDKEHFLIHQPA